MQVKSIVVIFVIHSTFIKLPFAINTFVLSISKLPLKTVLRFLLSYYLIMHVFIKCEFFPQNCVKLRKKCLISGSCSGNTEK